MRGDFLFDVLLFLHILTVIVGFGSMFVWPALSMRARRLPPDQSYAVSHMVLGLSVVLTGYFMIGIGVTGVLLILVADFIEFSDTWISIAFLLYILALVLYFALHRPNLRAMDRVQAALSSGDAGAADVDELQRRRARAQMYGGMLHLLFLLLLIDMIWKPGA